MNQQATSPQSGADKVFEILADGKMCAVALREKDAIAMVRGTAMTFALVPREPKHTPYLPRWVRL